MFSLISMNNGWIVFYSGHSTRCFPPHWLLAIIYIPGRKPDCWLGCGWHQSWWSFNLDCVESRWAISGGVWYTTNNYYPQDSRIRTGIPIIGCPDYLTLIKHRANTSGVPFAPPYLPESLVETIKRIDPASHPYKATDASNPFLGKKILVLSGQEDTLVPWSASKAFVEGLQVGADGKKAISVQSGVGHECTAQMVQEMSNFIVEEVLKK